MNPNVEQLFNSNKNYMKHALVGQVEMNKPATLNGTTFNYETEYVITHNLGMIPLVRAWYDQHSDGTIMAVNGQYGIQTGFGPTIDFWFYVDEITTTTVTLKAEDIASNSGTFIAYYKIYLDYEA